MTGGTQAALALREMLRLHDLRDTPETPLALEGLVSVDARPGVARVPGMRPGSFARGLDVALTFEPHAWLAGGPVPAGRRAGALPCTAGVGQRLRQDIGQPSRPQREVAAWPARSGTRVLL